MCTKLLGGALVPAKSWYWLVDFEWNDEEWSHKENLEEAAIRINYMNEDTA